MQHHGFRISTFRLAQQALADMSWSFAKAGHGDARVFSAVAKAVKRQADEFDAQSLAKTVWALATSGENSGGLGAELFAMLAHAAQPLVGTSNAQNLANVA
eukprot:gnl/TRDRNA2_/TRDRNA2_153584_c2_seq1.p2 gnl/TRDRNA2_/TRDRNA2_153584_c2~~gnl/TRDRNA2_/TRDRNA2_153584_c2_seq1.p2  ORF type:complete len:101 (+),score=18.49 gnl/TRDRNA2_/TRDRNA2_153584_c2_seq1:56-358(+)